MSIVALALNGLLASLLLAALALGFRLDRKLKGVRDGQSAFVLAVSELNAAASKAQGALADLRAATDEATDVLGGRISRAREAADRLDKLVSRAEIMPQPTAAPAPMREAIVPSRDGEGGLAALLARMEASSEAPRTLRSAERAPRFMQRDLDDDLFVDIEGRA